MYIHDLQPEQAHPLLHACCVKKVETPAMSRGESVGVCCSVLLQHLVIVWYSVVQCVAL